MVSIFSAGNSMEKLQNILSGEMAWSSFQCVKVLRHNGLHYHDLLSGSAKPVYKENTSILSYYVAKSVFMNYLNAFIEWTMEENRGSLCFKKSEHTVNSFAELLGNLAHDEFLLKKMDSVEKWYSVYAKNSNRNIEMLKTLKMTNYV
jgi:hypothetical protein